MPPKFDLDDSLIYAFQNFGKAASTIGISLKEATEAISKMAQAAEENTTLPGDTSRRAQYKTLNYKYEVEKRQN